MANWVDDRRRKMGNLSVGAYRSLRKEAQRLRDAIFRSGESKPVVEMRDRGIYVNGTHRKVSDVRELRRTFEARPK